MEVPCLHCGSFFLPRNRAQNYCSMKECQKARRAAWQRDKVRNDREYRESQQLSQKKWQHNNPDYWKQYRQNNPDKTERNRTLQRIRNKRCKMDSKPHLIVKMDVSNRGAAGLSGQYWLVPMIAGKRGTRLRRWT